MALSYTREFHLSDTGKILSGSKGRLGMNAYFPNRWSQQHIFANHLKTCEPPANHNNALPGTVDANGYIDGSTSGSWRILGTDGDYHRDGTWIITWSGTAGTDTCYLQTNANVTLTYDGPNDSPAVNRVEYSISNLAQVLYIICTGAPTDVKFFHTDDETRIDNGNVLTQQFIDNFSGIDIFRVMDLHDANNNHMRNYVTEEVIPYTYSSWAYDKRYRSSTEYTSGMPLRAIAEIGVELDCDLWINVPHQLTDSAVTSWITELWNNLTTGWKSSHKLWVELSNEPWQSGASAAFADQARWFEVLDGTVHEATMDPTNTRCTETAHGHTTGREFRCFNNYKNDGWPYARGAKRYAIVEDANNFRLATTEEAATRVTDAQDETDYDNTGDNGTFAGGSGHAVSDVITITGGTTVTVDAVSSGAVTEFTINNNGDSTGGHATTDVLSQTGTTGSGTGFSITIGLNNLGNDAYVTTDPDYQAFLPDDDATLLRYIPTDTSSKTKQVNYAERAVAVWDLIEAVVGAGNFYRVGGGWASLTSSWSEPVMDVSSFRAAYDYWSIAVYSNPTGYTTNYENESNAQILQDYKDNYADTWVADNIAVIGCGRIVGYEGGDSSGHNSPTAAQISKLSDFRTSQEQQDWYDFYYRRVIADGLLVFNQYALIHSTRDEGTNWWAVALNPGDTTSPRYLAYMAKKDGISRE